jgi:alpha-glucosidase (family GH31 glycosyl hydrolase)
MTHYTRRFWQAIDKHVISKGIDAIWTDETEPDIPPTEATTLLDRAQSTSMSILYLRHLLSITACATNCMNVQ